MSARLALATLVAASAAPGAAAAQAAPPPLVPASVQHAIAKRTAVLAYVPARIAPGYRYAAWRYAGGRVLIRFLNRAGKEVLFIAEPPRGTCTDGRERTFQMAGNKVYWSHNAVEQQAWRCVNGVRLVAATPQPSRAFADVGLGTIVASGHKVR